MIKALNYKITFSNGQERKNSAEFELGSTLITGKNGRGKSLNLEMIAFCLFGNQALRGKAEDYARIKAELTLTIRDQEYTLKRTKSNAEVKVGEDKIVEGSTPVNQWVKDTLGFGYEVFCISHWCKQGEIQALADMKPAERKKMVDDVTGLTSLDGLVTAVQEQIRQLNADVQASERHLIAPLEPVKPSSDEAVLMQQQELLENELSEYRAIEKEVNNLVQPIEPMKPTPPMEPVKPSQPELLKVEFENVPEVVIPELFQDKNLPEVEKELFEKLLKLQQANHEKTKLEAELKSVDPQSFQNLTEEQLKSQLDYYDAAKLKQALLNQGETRCPNCGSNHPIATLELGKYQHIDLSVLSKPAPTWQQFEVEKRYHANLRRLQELNDELKNIDIITKLHKQVTELNQEIARAQQAKARNELKKAQAEQGYESAIRSWTWTCEQMDAQYQQQLANYRLSVDNYEMAMASFKKECERQDNLITNFEHYGRDFLNETRQALENARSDLTKWAQYHAQFAEYVKQKRSYDLALENVNQMRALLEDQRNAKEALAEIKQRVKTYILPSLNSVASFLLNEMTGGEHSVVTVEDNFEVQVDNQPLRTLSGSTKDITNLAIRIALGRILTHKVLRFMMMDEIDSAMDEDRASFTWQCLQKITPNIGQILQVSHKQLPATHHITVN